MYVRLDMSEKSSCVNPSALRTFLRLLLKAVLVCMGMPRAGMAAFLAHIHHEAKNGESTLKPLISGLAAAGLGKLPDQLEPAIHPNHRQFFHSLAMAGMVGYGMYKTYKWQPDDPVYQMLRWVLLIAGGAYLTHLVMDRFTAKSLPLVGKLG